MGNVVSNTLGWDSSDDFIAFAFGDFNSKKIDPNTEGRIYRTSDGDRYNINLSPQLTDITAEVPGGDGQYFFGTQHKTKVFDVSFAFDNLTEGDLRKLKQAFDGKEVKQLCFAEDCTFSTSYKNYKIYNAKVTGQPVIKAVCFDESHEVIQGDQTTTEIRKIYKGEGTVQFTAYWPYAFETASPAQPSSRIGNGANQPSFTMTNSGDVPTSFVFSSKINGVTKITLTKGTTTPALVEIAANNIRYWDSKTGIVKDSNGVIYYSGCGVFEIPSGDTVKVTITGPESYSSGDYTGTYYNWYY